MLLLSTKLQNIPIISVRGGARIGVITEPIVNPHNLHIDGFWCTTVHSKDPLVLLDMDIREFSPRGIVIDDHLGLSEPDELVRLKNILDIRYQLENKAVLASGKKQGKVAEYAIDDKSLFVQKLYVIPPMWKGSIAGTRLIFDRASIIEVTDTHISVNGPEEKAGTKLTIGAKVPSANYSSASSSLISENE